MTNGSLMKVESIAKCSLNTFDLHKAIIGLENQFWFLGVAVLDKSYCKSKQNCGDTLNETVETHVKILKQK